MPDYPTILHHGGHDGVTGSCHELRVSDAAGILVDCGLPGRPRMDAIRDSSIFAPEAGPLFGLGEGLWMELQADYDLEEIRRLTGDRLDR